MVSGAPSPGGFGVIPSGGHRAPAPGGTDLNSTAMRAMYGGYPDFDISPYGDSSGARVNQIRSAANIRLGRATSVTSYLWTLPTRPGGSVAAVVNGATATANFTPDVAGTYVFRCVVTFSDGTVVTEEVVYISA